MGGKINDCYGATEGMDSDRKFFWSWQEFCEAIVENGDYVVATARKKEALLELQVRYPEQIMALFAGSGYYGASKCAKLIIEAVKTSNSPFQFILGADAWEVYKQREQMQNEEMTPWLEKSRKTKF